MTTELRRARGVRDLSIYAGNTEALVVRDPRQTRDADLTEAVGRAGFSARLIPTATVHLAVGNLECDACPQQAQAALRQIRGMKRAFVHPEEKEAVVIYDTRRTSPDVLVRVLKRAGFPAREE